MILQLWIVGLSLTSQMLMPSLSPMTALSSTPLWFITVTMDTGKMCLRILLTAISIYKCLKHKKCDNIWAYSPKQHRELCVSKVVSEALQNIKVMPTLKVHASPIIAVFSSIE